MTSKSTAFNFMRGGQLFFSFFAMTVGVIKKNLMLFVYCWGVLSLIGLYYLTSDDHREYGIKWALAKVNTEYLFNGDTRTELTYKDGRRYNVPWRSIAANPKLKAHWTSLEGQAITIVIGASVLTLAMYILWIYGMSRFGRSQSEDGFIRGGHFATKREHDARVKKEEKAENKKATITLAGYRVPPKSDNTHFLLLGAPSVGKSATIIEYLQQVREVGGRCFIYDRNGDFTKIFYREGHDIILNPNDARSANWTVWSEGCDQMQYRTISKALIPDVGNDPFWSQAARLVFESLCHKVAELDTQRGGQPDMEHLMTVLLRMDDEKMASILTGTDAGSVFNMNSEKMAASIRATLTTYIEPLKYMQRVGGRTFSFKDWVQSSTDSWIFIPIKATEIDLFKPLITTWAEQYSKTILERPSDSHKQDLRFNLIIDELSSLGKLATLDTYLSEARKFGGNALLGTQSQAQIEDIYGNKGAAKLAGSIGTYIVFRNNSPDGAEWSSKLLLKEEIREVNDNLTVGHADVRDSLNMNKNRKDRALVTPSQIVNLPDLEGYIRFGRGYGLLNFKQTYPTFTEQALPFVPWQPTESMQSDDLDEISLESLYANPSSDGPETSHFVAGRTTDHPPQYGTAAHREAYKNDNNTPNQTVEPSSPLPRKPQSDEDDDSEGMTSSKAGQVMDSGTTAPPQSAPEQQPDSRSNVFTRGL